MSNRASSIPTGRSGARAWIRRSRASSLRRGTEVRSLVPSVATTATPIPSCSHQRRDSRLSEPLDPRITRRESPMGGSGEATDPPGSSYAIGHHQMPALHRHPEAVAVGHANSEVNGPSAEGLCDEAGRFGQLNATGTVGSVHGAIPPLGQPPGRLPPAPGALLG